MSAMRRCLVIIIPALVLLSAGWFLFFSKFSPLADTTPPTLKNLGGITLAPYNSATGQAGDVKFDKENIDATTGKEVKVFLFGQNLPKNAAGEPQRVNPNFEFGGIASQIKLISALDGVVADVQEQPETNDFELFISPGNRSVWTVSYDHITNLAVKKGDRVAAGQQLGVVAKDREAYRYEIQVMNDRTKVAACPSELLDPTVKDMYRSQLGQLVKDWEAWYGKAVYPNHSGGCVKSTITNDESQGK